MNFVELSASPSLSMPRANAKTNHLSQLFVASHLNPMLSKLLSHVTCELCGALCQSLPIDAPIKCKDKSFEPIVRRFTSACCQLNPMLSKLLSHVTCDELCAALCQSLPIDAPSKCKDSSFELIVRRFTSAGCQLNPMLSKLLSHVTCELCGALGHRCPEQMQRQLT